MTQEVPGWLRDMEDPSVLQRVLDLSPEDQPIQAAPVAEAAAPRVYQHRAMVNPAPLVPPVSPTRKELASRLPPVPAATDEDDGSD